MRRSSSIHINFNSHAHVERDADHAAQVATDRNFNSHAHVERDFFIWQYLFQFVISTHTLTWSVTVGFYEYSHGYWHFNSHAHVERDDITDKPPSTSQISTHTLTWSVTIGYLARL